MMTKPNVLILTGYGINCDYESQTAFLLAGAKAERVHINDIIDGHKKLDDYQILMFPGGFSYGDDIASGRVLANKFVTNLAEQAKRFIEKDKLVLGVCNGFQVMVKSGLLTAEGAPLEKQTLTLTYNDSDRFEDRWVHLKAEQKNTIFFKDIDTLYLPVAHGEGKFYADEAMLDALERSGRVALRYIDEEGALAGGRYPENPNGSPRDIAGITDETGRLMGLMPHPERFLFFTNHPHWTMKADALRREGAPLPEWGEGLKIFQNAVGYFS